MSGVAEAKRALGVPIHLHQDDLFLYENAVRTGMMFGLTVEEPPPVDRYYEGDAPIVVRRLRGARGSTRRAIARAASASRCRRPGDTAAPKLFVGDTLFAGSIGRTDLPGGDYDTLLKAITERAVRVPGRVGSSTPGTGPETTIGREKATNPFVLEYLAIESR